MVRIRESQRDSSKKRHAKQSIFQPRKSALLDMYQARCTAVRDLVHHVVTNEDTYGLYLFGARGCGKTTGIERALAELKKTPILFRGTTTGQSLFTEAKNASEGILWFNDDPGLLADPAAQQYLLAMLEDTSDPRSRKSCRLVTKSRVNTSQSDRFVFTGKIIFDSNVPIVSSRSRRVLEAVEDRLRIHHFDPTNAELAAVMRYLATLSGDSSRSTYSCIRLKDKDLKYWEQTSPKERLSVADHIIGEASKTKTSMSLRMFRDTLKYYVDQRKHEYQTDWRDVVAKELVQHDTTFRFSKPLSAKDERLASERAALAERLEDVEFMRGYFGDVTRRYKHEIIDEWCIATGQNDRQFRRRLAELPENLRSVYEQLPDRRSDNGT
jgi:hypothetical protein